MFFYVLVTPALLFLFWVAYKTKQIRKHDQVLYRFCHIRRNAIALIHTNLHDFNDKDYATTRNLLDHVSLMIHEYEACKTSVFNFRKFVNSMKYYRDKTREADKMDVPENKGIANLHLEYRKAVVKAFFAYTPWIKSEIMVRFAIAIFKILGRIGKKRILDKSIYYLNWACEEAKAMRKNNHCAHA